MSTSKSKDVSAILLSWKRLENLPPIVEELQSCPFIREILVWNNNPDVVLNLPGADVINSPRNFLTLPRYCLIPLARYPLIWLQDDDILLTRKQIQTVWEHYESPTVIYGVVGRNLGRGGKYLPANVPPGKADEVIRVQLFHRTEVGPMLSVLPTVHWEPGSYDDAEDDLYLCLSRGRSQCFVVDVGPIKGLHLPGSSTPGIARWKRQDHLARRQEAVNDIMERVWRI